MRERRRGRKRGEEEEEREKKREEEMGGGKEGPCAHSPKLLDAEPSAMGTCLYEKLIWLGVRSLESQ